MSFSTEDNGVFAKQPKQESHFGIWGLAMMFIIYTD